MPDDEPATPGDVQEATSEEVREMLDRIPDVEPPDADGVDLDDPAGDLPAIPDAARTTRGTEGGDAPVPGPAAVVALLAAAERRPSDELDRYHVRAGLNAADAGAGRVVLREVDSELDLLAADPDEEAIAAGAGGPLDMAIASTHGAGTIATALSRMGQVDWVVVTDVEEAGLAAVVDEAAEGGPTTRTPDQAETDAQFEELREEVGEAGFEEVEAALEDVSLDDVGDVPLDDLVGEGPAPAEVDSTAEALLAELRSGQVAGGTVAELRSALGAAPAGAEGGDGDVGDLRTTVETLSDAVTAATDDRRDLAARIDALEEQVEALADRVEAGGVGGDVDDRLSAIEEEVAAVREDVERGKAWRRSLHDALSNPPGREE